MTIEEQIATELIERTKWNESPHYAGRIEGDGLRDEIEALERGEFRYYVPQTYINKIKKWVK